MAARAEARRRKILANSEERLQRLTGRLGSAGHSEDSKDVGVNVDAGAEKGDDNKYSDDVSPSDQGAEANSLHDQVDTSDRCREEKDGLTPEKALSEPFEITKETSPASRQTNSASNIRYRRAPTSTLPTSPVEESQEAEGQHKGDGDNGPALVRQIEITRLVSCVVAAILTRWFLPTLLGYLVLKSSAVMFLLMEGALFVHQKQLLETVMLPHKSHLMAGALLLCGIKPELITTYNRVMGVASTVFEDLMLYYFTFITCHLLLTYM